VRWEKAVVFWETQFIDDSRQTQDRCDNLQDGQVWSDSHHLRKWSQKSINHLVLSNRQILRRSHSTSTITGMQSPSWDMNLRNWSFADWQSCVFIFWINQNFENAWIIFYEIKLVVSDDVFGFPFQCRLDESQSWWYHSITVINYIQRFSIQLQTNLSLTFKDMNGA
jgi:hypothetical protein